jgi:hypothetical protein
LDSKRHLPLHCQRRVSGLPARRSRPREGLGHRTHISLVEYLGGLVGSITLEKMSSLQLTSTQAYEKALSNLEGLLKSGEIRAQLFAEGPDGRPFILVGGHWDAAACALLPGLVQFARGNLRASERCFSIPHPACLLIFPKGDRAYRDAMREMIRTREGHERKLLTFELFTFDGAIPVPLIEE